MQVDIDMHICMQVHVMQEVRSCIWRYAERGSVLNYRDKVVEAR